MTVTVIDFTFLLTLLYIRVSHCQITRFIFTVNKKINFLVCQKIPVASRIRTKNLLDEKSDLLHCYATEVGILHSNNVCYVFLEICIQEKYLIIRNTANVIIYIFTHPYARADIYIYIGK